MKYILIFIFLLASIQIYAQALYTESNANIYIQGASNLDGTVSATTPNVYIKGNVENAGTIYNNGEIQATANFANTGTFTSTGEEVLSGTTIQTLSGDFSNTNQFHHLIIDKSANNVLLGGNIEVGDMLSLLNGTLDLANYDATMSASATIAGATNTKYIITSGTGSLKQTVSSSNVVFPIGNSSYNPVTLANSGTTDIFAARVADQVGCGGSNTLASTYKVNKMWYLAEAVAGGSNATITTQWNTAAEATDFNRNNSALSSYNGSEFELSATNSAATNAGTDTWTQTQSNQTTISPLIVTSVAAITGGNVAFCDAGTAVLTAPTDASATYQWLKNGANILSANSQTYAPTESGIYTVAITSGTCVMLPKEVSMKLLSLATATIAPTDGTARTATHECTDGITNWTHYYDASPLSGSYLLLSVKKNGNTGLGTVPTTATVLLGGDAVGGVNITSPFVQNTSGWTVMSRYWKFTPDTEPTTDVDVRFYFNDADIDAVKTVSGNSTIAVDSLFFYKINDISATYDPNPINGQTGIPLATTYKTNGIWMYMPGANASANSWEHTTMGANGHIAEFVVGHFGGGGGGGTGDNNPPFPIELLSFRGYNEGAINRLFWTTEKELNGDKFKVERSVENGSFEEIGEVKAVGNSNKQENYAFNDKTFKANRNFYRLKMLDKDGAFAYSKVIEIATNNQNITIYPNPAQNEVFIAGNFAANSKASLINMLGQEVLNLNLDSQNQTTVPLQNVSQGVYMLNILNEKGAIMYSEKLMKE